MSKLSTALLALLIALSGCSTRTIDRDSEARAKEHMRMADSLENIAAFREAAIEYGIVAELYPRTSYYPAALRQSAYLRLHPDNESANDSIAVHWFHEYLKASPPSPERRAVEVCVHLLDRIRALRNAIASQRTENDSLESVTKKQAGDLQLLTSRAKQVQSLEAELKKTNEELQKLREVDVRISKGKER